MLEYDSERIRILRKELAAKEKELADQKWLFEQFLKSPSWRWTLPLRWVGRRLRGLVRPPAEEAPFVRTPGEESPHMPPVETPGDIKASFTSLCKTGLAGFLGSGANLNVPNSADPVVSVILVLHNRADLTLACLRSIMDHPAQDLEVVIVDNASSDETPALLGRLNGAHIIRNEDNRHFLRAVNQAAGACRGEYLLLLNNDAQLLSGSLQAALSTIRASDDIGAVGGRIILLDSSLQEAGNIVWRDGSCLGYGRGDNPFAPMYSFTRNVDYCSGAFLLTPRRIWNELGGFDDTFHPAYYEETDYCMRLRQRGLRVVYEPRATVIHYEFASSQSAESAVRLQAEHQELFAKRHRTALESHEPFSPDRLLEARSRDPRPRLLFIDDRVPHLWLGSGFPRAHALLRALLGSGYFVTLYPLGVIDESWDLAYSDIPDDVELMLGLGPIMLESFLRSRVGYYSTIVVSRPHNMGTLAPILKGHPDWFENVQVIYDAEALFASRLVAYRELQGDPLPDDEKRKTFAEEVALTALTARVISVSENERKTFLDHGVKHVDILGHSLEVRPTDSSFDQRNGFLFVGAIHEETSPNADALLWFLGEIFPRVQAELGDTLKVTIAGVNTSRRVRELAGPSIRLMGRLPDLSELYSTSRVFIAPTRYAAGIPHKIHEAAARGLPVVATPLLAEQLGWTERELAIGRGAESFAARCIEVHRDAAKWTSLREAAMERVRLECSPGAFERKVQEIVGAKPTTERKGNCVASR